MIPYQPLSLPSNMLQVFLVNYTSTSTVKACKTQLQHAWSALIRPTQNEVSAIHEAHLADLADELATQLSTSHEKAVSMINTKEKDKCMYCHLVTALGMTKLSLTQIDVPDDNGRWSTLIHHMVQRFTQRT